MVSHRKTATPVKHLLAANSAHAPSRKLRAKQCQHYDSVIPILPFSQLTLRHIWKENPPLVNRSPWKNNQLFSICLYFSLLARMPSDKGRGVASPMAIENTKNAIVLGQQNQVSIFHTRSPAIPRGSVGAAGRMFATCFKYQVHQLRCEENSRKLCFLHNMACPDLWTALLPKLCVAFAKTWFQHDQLIATGSHLCHSHIELLLRATEMIGTQAWVNV